MKRAVVVSDLDGTLLDQTTYRFDAARPALQVLRERHIPLVLCSSKTRLEIEHYRRLLNNTDPFIVENGGAVIVPKGYFPLPVGDREREEYEVLELGIPYATLVTALEQCRRQTGVSLTGFHELSTDDVARLTGLPQQEAQWAKMREYDEPFLLGREEDRPKVEAWVRRAGFQITRGGLFSHLTGNNDKGQAVRALLTLYRRWHDCRAIGLGDSANDLAMLKAVDVPLLVQRPDGAYTAEVNDPTIVRVAGIGPVGWNRAVLDLLADGRHEDCTTTPRREE